MDGVEAIAMVSVLGILGGSVVSVVKTTAEHFRQSRADKAQAELYGKLLDKFGSSQELLAYLQSEAGQTLLKTPVAARPGAPTNRILNSVQFGIVILLLGAALMGIRGMVSPGQEALEVMTVFGMLGMFLGAGLLISAAASWKLSQMWGLMNGKTHEG
jgi:hypothetical protein